MDYIKKYTAIRVETRPNRGGYIWKANLSFGPVLFEYGERKSPYIEHETEEEAIKYAYNTDKYALWLILPIIKFADLNTKNYENQ